MLVNQQTRQVQIQSKMKIQTHPLQCPPNSNRIKENHRLLIRGQIQIQIQMNTQTHTWQGSQQTGTARLVGWRINPVAGGQLHPTVQLKSISIFIFCFVISVFVIVFVFVFCQEQLPFVTNGVENYHFLTYCVKDL